MNNYQDIITYIILRLFSGFCIFFGLFILSAPPVMAQQLDCSQPSDCSILVTNLDGTETYADTYFGPYSVNRLYTGQAFWFCVSPIFIHGGLVYYWPSSDWGTCEENSIAGFHATPTEHVNIYPWDIAYADISFTQPGSWIVYSSYPGWTCENGECEGTFVQGCSDQVSVTLTSGVTPTPTPTNLPTSTPTRTPTYTPTPIRYAITTYVDLNSASGHVFSKITNADNYSSYCNVKMGWYPVNDNFMNDVGVLRNDSSRTVNVELTSICSNSTTQGAANFLNSINDGLNYYILLNNNCVHVAKNVFSRAYGTIPSTQCVWLNQVTTECPSTYASWLISVGGIEH